MKNKYLKLIFVVICFLFANTIGMPQVDAVSGGVSVKSSSSRILVGSTVTITATVYSTSPLGSWDCTLSYNSSKLSFVSSTASGQRMVGYGDGAKKSTSYTFKFKAKASGTAAVYISAASILDWTTEAELSAAKGSTSISIITQAQLDASYSSNNNLSSLSIDNATLSPAFSADVTSYTAELEPNTTSIKVNATAADSKSSIAGAGVVTVVDGSNTINIVVTAENGKQKIYTINATVKELAPIEVKVDSKTYTIVRKEGIYQAPTSFEKTTIKIGNEDVLAYTNKKIGCVVIGLRDKDNNVAIYLYNVNTKQFTLYKNITVGSTNLYLKKLENMADVPVGFENANFKINNVSVDAWNYKNSNKFYLIYGVNTENGEETFYLYDKERSTIQRFYGEQLSDLEKQLNLYTIIIAAVGIVTISSIMTSIVLLVKSSKKKKGSYKKSTMDDYLEKEKQIEKELVEGKKKK